MLKKILIALVVVLVAILIFATTKPDNFQVERSTTINASPEKIYPLINDLHAWTTWSPFEKVDPNMKKTFSGAPEGVGAAYDWEGNRKAGAGRMEITETSPYSHVTMSLSFLKPFKAHNIVDFSLDSANGSTKVTWAMHGPNPYISKVIGVFCSMDKLIGKDFETGLANLKALAEK